MLEYRYEEWFNLKSSPASVLKKFEALGFSFVKTRGIAPKIVERVKQRLKDRAMIRIQKEFLKEFEDGFTLQNLFTEKGGDIFTREWCKEIRPGNIKKEGARGDSIPVDGIFCGEVPAAYIQPIREVLQEMEETDPDLFAVPEADDEALELAAGILFINGQRMAATNETVRQALLDIQRGGWFFESFQRSIKAGWIPRGQSGGVVSRNDKAGRKGYQGIPVFQNLSKKERKEIWEKSVIKPVKEFFVGKHDNRVEERIKAVEAIIEEIEKTF